MAAREPRNAWVWLRRLRDLLTSLRTGLDLWFGTAVRYAGLVLVAWAVFGDHLHHVDLLTAAMGMILFKSVWGKD